MAKNRYAQAQFLVSAAKLHQLPEDEGIEVAFAGRSNAGKSSALNRLTNNKQLAFTSKTPGRTQLINLFAIGDASQQQRLVDLPGYGYAKVPLAMKLNWQKTLAAYLQHRKCLKGLVILMDIRHPLKELDVDLLAWAAECQLATHVLLTKSDKLKRSQAASTLVQVKQHLASYPQPISVQLFSALKNQGIEELQGQLDSWFLP